MELRAAKIACKLGRKTIDGNFSPEVTGNYQICDDQTDFLMQVLDSERKDEHLVETQKFMNNEALFHEFAWDKVVEWMDEGMGEWMGEWMGE